MKRRRTSCNCKWKYHSWQQEWPWWKKVQSHFCPKPWVKSKRKCHGSLAALDLDNDVHWAETKIRCTGGVASAAQYHQIKIFHVCMVYSIGERDYFFNVCFILESLVNLPLQVHVRHQVQLPSCVIAIPKKYNAFALFLYFHMVCFWVQSKQPYDDLTPTS